LVVFLGNPNGGPYSTMLSCPHPTETRHPLRNCRGLQLARGVLGVEEALGLAVEVEVEVVVLAVLLV